MFLRFVQGLQQLSRGPLPINRLLEIGETDATLIEGLPVISGTHERSRTGDALEQFGGIRKGAINESDEGIDRNKMLKWPKRRNAGQGSGNGRRRIGKFGRRSHVRKRDEAESIDSVPRPELVE